MEIKGKTTQKVPQKHKTNSTSKAQSMQISNDILFLNKTLLSALDMFTPSHRFTVEENQSVKDYIFFTVKSYGRGCSAFSIKNGALSNKKAIPPHSGQSAILIHLIEQKI